MAELLGKLAYEHAKNTDVRELRRLVGLVDGRGACRHPDGTARMIRSALQTFAADIEHHQHRSCEVAGVEVSAV
jgi:NADH:ubiquinone oxidoreductase subunit F (NADH-binding)